MLRTLELLVVFGIFAMLTGACGSSQKAEMQSFTAADDGKTVELQSEEQFQVTLEGNPSTGYTWELEANGETVRQVGEALYESSSDALGAGGMMTFTFETATPGETNLRLVYHRPWETDVPPEKSFELKLVVK